MLADFPPRRATNGKFRAPANGRTSRRVAAFQHRRENISAWRAPQPPPTRRSECRALRAHRTKSLPEEIRDAADPLPPKEPERLARPSCATTVRAQGGD